MNVSWKLKTLIRKLGAFYKDAPETGTGTVTNFTKYPTSFQARRFQI
jgi:hypothetical protein